jgi:hypothetical protein
MHAEPECVSEVEQRHMTGGAHRVERDRRVDQWRRTHAFIDAAIASFATPTVIRCDPGLEGVLEGVRCAACATLIGVSAPSRRG